MPPCFKKGALLYLAVAFAASGCAGGEIRAGQNPHGDSTLMQRVERFQLQAPSLLDALLELGKRAKQPLGIEYVDPTELQKPIRIDLREGTFEDALRAILRGQKGYSWSAQNGVVVITHAGVPKGEANLLDRVLPSFSISAGTPEEASHVLEMDLFFSLHPGPVGIVGEYDPGLREKAKAVGPLRLTNVTVRQVLNRIAGDARDLAWVVGVPPGEMGQWKNTGLWFLVEYDDALVMGHVGERLRHATPAVAH
jgi:hypothetical protein